MRFSVPLLFAASVSFVFASKPGVYNTTLRESLFDCNAKTKEVNRTADEYFESQQNHTFLSELRSAFRKVPNAFRHHSLHLNETVLVNGTNYTRAQLEAALDAFVDIQYVHNATEVSTLSSPTVQKFSASLPKRDRKAFAGLLEEQRRMSESELEAFFEYPTTRAWVDCAASSPRGNLSAFTACRHAHDNSDNSLMSPDDAKYASLFKRLQLCKMTAFVLYGVSLGLLIPSIIFMALGGSLPVVVIVLLALIMSTTTAAEFCQVFALDKMNELNQKL